MTSHSPRSQRQLRVGEVLRQSIADYFARQTLSYKELAGKSITVSEVKISPDLRNATVYVMPLGGEEQQQVEEALNKMSATIRYKMASTVRLKSMPQLIFKIDTSFDQATHVNHLLDNPTVKQDLSNR